VFLTSQTPFGMTELVMAEGPEDPPFTDSEWGTQEEAVQLGGYCEIGVEWGGGIGAYPYVEGGGFFDPGFFCGAPVG
jgi:hypothetical protein